MGENESKKSAKSTESINYLTDYSKQSRLLTDFTPDIIAIALQTRYSHRLQKLFEIIEGRKLNVKRVRDVLQDLRANNDKIFMGLITGVIENEGELIDLLNEMKLQPKIPFEAINEAIKEIV